MGKKIKKGTKGEASQFVTRSMALKKLQLSLREFRKLCILKGIFPKDPKRKFKGQNKTYYYLKDIRFLAHEKLIRKFKEISAFNKRLVKIKAKSMNNSRKYDYKQMKAKKPEYEVNHIIKERYPKFIDALNDVDDAMSLLSLFSILSKHELLNIKTETVEICKRLSKEFLLYASVSQSFKRGFISIKGLYINVEIAGNDIIWLSPFSLPQKFPFEVDYDIILSFLELYSSLMKFVNFKLYKDIGLEYPPPVEQIDTPMFGLNSKTIRELQDKINSNKNLSSTNEVNNKDLIESEEMKKIKKREEESNRAKQLFRPYVFFISREVPKEIFQLVIASAGGMYGDDSEESSFQQNDSAITHYIVDKPSEFVSKKANKEYVQPQWVFDCVNSNKVLPTSSYAPGKRLPPHLSPFYEQEQEEYKIKNIKKPRYESTNNTTTAVIITASNNMQVDKEEPTEEKEDLREMMLSKNKKKLLQKIREETLRKKRKSLLN